MLDLATLLCRARRVVVFTGAGMSTGSGIPDFRGPRGLWTRRRPVYFQDFLAFAESRAEYWDQKLEAWDAFAAARPNAAHLALVELEGLGRLEAIVTQNIDGLHQAAGSSPDRVIEVHGTNREVECVACGQRTLPEPALAAFRDSGEPPTCPCGGWLKFATISFGQALRDAVLARAFAVAGVADLMLAAGSTLSVQPAASIPLVAQHRGVPYVVINRGATDHDHIATLRLEGDVGELLPPAVAALRGAGA